MKRFFILLLMAGSIFAHAQSAKNKDRESYFLSMRKAANGNMVILELHTKDTRSMMVEHFEATTKKPIGYMKVDGVDRVNNFIERHEYRGDFEGNKVSMLVRLPNGASVRISKAISTTPEYYSIAFEENETEGCAAGQERATVNTKACGRTISVTLCCTPPVVLNWDDNCNITCN